MLNQETGEIKITDFGIASELTHENEEYYQPVVIEGTLRYISPEQSGRMNRAIDYRSDLYSLGMVFYELVTGSTPFNGDSGVAIIGKLAYESQELELAFDDDTPEDVREVVVAVVPGDVEPTVDGAVTEEAGIEAVDRHEQHVAVAKARHLAHEGGLPLELRKKIALFASLPVDAIVSGRDVDNIYKIPLHYHAEGMDDFILEHFGLEAATPELSAWERLIRQANEAQSHPPVRIALVGKYVKLEEARRWGRAKSKSAKRSVCRSIPASWAASPRSRRARSSCSGCATPNV